MTGGLTQYARDKQRDKLLLGVNYTPPATWYFAAYITVTTETGGGTEVTGGSYSRPVIVFAAHGSTGSGEATPSADITIADMPACTILAVAFLDASSAGNMWIHKPLDAPITLTAGQSLSIPAADILIRCR